MNVPVAPAAATCPAGDSPVMRENKPAFGVVLNCRKGLFHVVEQLPSRIDRLCWALLITPLCQDIS